MRIHFLWVFLFISYSYIQINAEYECAAGAERDADGKCVCKPGLHGGGTFCCLPEDHKICMVEGDPIIRTMNGDLIPLELPCPTLIAEVHTVGPLYDETVYVFAAGEFGRNGILNMDYLRLEFEERYNDIHTVVEIIKGNLTINGKNHDNSQSYYSEHYEVELHYNASMNTYTMKSMGTTLIRFMPPSQASDEQRVIPGVCVGVARESLLYDVGMCNQRRRGLQRSTINKGFKFLQAGVVEHVIRTLPFYQEIGPDKVQEMCLEINRSRRRCRARWNPSIGTCYIIVSHPDIRYCLAAQGLDIMRVFWKCTRAHCGMDSNSCTDISSKAISQCVTLKPDCRDLY